jgi:hypothetical protein
MISVAELSYPIGVAVQTPSGTLQGGTILAKLRYSSVNDAVLMTASQV